MLLQGGKSGNNIQSNLSENSVVALVYAGVNRFEPGDWCSCVNKKHLFSEFKYCEPLA